MEPIHQSEMRGFEARAFLYELPLMMGWLLLGAVLAAVFAYSYTHYPDHPRTIQVIFLGSIALGLVMAFYSASFFPRRAILYPDRLRFVMAFSSREVRLSEIESLRALAPEEVKQTFFSPRFVSMSPCVTGAVELRRRRGRAWVFSPVDPEELVGRALAARAGEGSAQPGPEVSAPGEV